MKIEVGTMIWRTTDPMIGFVEKVSGDMYYIRWYNTYLHWLEMAAARTLASAQH